MDYEGVASEDLAPVVPLNLDGNQICLLGTVCCLLVIAVITIRYKRTYCKVMKQRVFTGFDAWHPEPSSLKTLKNHDRKTTHSRHYPIEKIIEEELYTPGSPW